MARFLAPRVKSLLPSLVVFDFEWSADGKIYAASFVTETKEKVLLVADYQDEAKFISAIQDIILAFPISIGFNTLGLLNSRDSDLDNLTLNAQRLGIEPIFDRQLRIIKGRSHIDMIRVFEKKLVRNSMYKNQYRDNKLETISQFFLKRGKTGHGDEAHTYDKEKLTEYVLEDSRIVFDLLSVGMPDKKTDEIVFDGALLDTMKAIADLVGVGFDKACNGNLSQWWTKILNDAHAPLSKEERRVQPKDPSSNERAYKGGELIEPVPGRYENTDVFDVQSLYPTIIENWNISHETINCECCKDDITARLPEGVMPSDHLYWICKKQEGILAKFIRRFKAERVKHKAAGHTAQAEGLKILLNGAYGLYGSPYFKYSDILVAQIITALARWTTFRQIKPIAEMAGFNVIYGDTDSLFAQKQDANADISNIIETAKAELNIVLEHEKIFRDLVISKKKHYMGAQIQKDGSVKVVVKGIEWIKGDRGKWVNLTGKKIEQAFKDKADMLAVVTQALDDLDNDRIPKEQLKLGIRLTKDGKDYKGNSMQKQIAQLNPGTQAGQVAFYFKGIHGRPTLDPTRIDRKKYREVLLNTCEDVLKIMGYKTEGLDPDHVQTLDMLWQ
jgi:DNA polymerase elongation subunit (family B)